MSEAATANFFEERPDPGRTASVALAAAVHLLLLAVLLFGVRWQNRPAEAVVVELWREPPPPPVQVVEPKPEPKPEPVPPPAPVVEPPKPEPVIEKPDIAIKEPPPKPKPEVVKPKPVPKPEPKLKPEPKPRPEVVKPKPQPVPPKVEAKPRLRDDEMKKRMDEQLAREQVALQNERERQAIKDRLERDAAATRNKGLEEYIARIQAKVKSKWILPLEMKGNPQAVFDVVQLPTGEVLTVKLVRSSGIPAYDQAVERAILSASPLPRPANEALFSRELRLTFKPRD